MSTIRWTEDGHDRAARWHSESDAPAPSRIVIVGDDTTANTAYRLAREGVGLLWRGDYHNARQLLRAVARRVDGHAARRSGVTSDFFAYRAAKAERARVLSRLIVELDADHALRLRRAPEVQQACRDAYGEPEGPMCVSLTELHGVLSARGWHERGVPIPALDARIHPCYGVFSPVRGEDIDLLARAPLPARTMTAFDLGTGTGVLAAVLALRGVPQVTATDINPRAVACARANLARLGYAEHVRVIETDLYPRGRADLIVCNPPWIPARPTSALEQGIYDPDADMLHRLLDGMASHLTPPKGRCSNRRQQRFEVQIRCPFLVADSAVLDFGVVLLNGCFDVGDEHGLAFAVSAFGVPADQLLVQGDGRVVAGRVRLECPTDETGPFGVGFDDAHLASELVTLGDVEIPDGCLAVCAASTGLLVHAFGDFTGEVAAVELSDRGHDAVQQHPGRCLVDVLRRRDEHDPGLFQSQMDRHVISAVTSEPIDLVNDAVGDLVGLDVLDHPDQVRTVCPAGGFTRVDELLDDDGIQLTCLAKIRLSTS